MEITLNTPHMRTPLFTHQIEGVRDAYRKECMRHSERGARGGRLKVRLYMSWLAWSPGSGKSIMMIALAGAVFETRETSVVSQSPSKRRRVNNRAGIEVTIDDENDACTVPTTVVVVSSLIVEQWASYLDTFTYWAYMKNVTPENGFDDDEMGYLILNSPLKARLYVAALRGDYQAWRAASKRQTDEARFREMSDKIRVRVPFVLVKDAVYSTLCKLLADAPEICFTRLVFDEFDTLRLAETCDLLRAEFFWYVSANTQFVTSGAPPTKQGVIADKMTSTMELFRGSTDGMTEYMGMVNVDLNPGWKRWMGIPDEEGETVYCHLLGPAPHPDAREAVRTVDRLVAECRFEEVVAVLRQLCPGFGEKVFLDADVGTALTDAYLGVIARTHSDLAGNRRGDDLPSRCRDLLDDKCQITHDHLSGLRALTCCLQCLKHFSLGGILQTAVHQRRRGDGESQPLRCSCPNCKKELRMDAIPVLFRGANKYSGLLSREDALLKATFAIFGALDGSPHENACRVVESRRQAIVFYDREDEPALRALIARLFPPSNGGGAAQFLIDSVRKTASNREGTGLRKALMLAQQCKTPAILLLEAEVFKCSLNIEFVSDVVLACRRTDPMALERAQALIAELGSERSASKEVAEARKFVNFSADLRMQLVGRAQRFGREHPLRVHVLSSGVPEVAEARDPELFRPWLADGPVPDAAHTPATNGTFDVDDMVARLLD